MIDSYFQDELAYLRESGAEFAQRFPKLVSYLGASATDPDVQRILEGFAFLVSRLRLKIDDQLPELTQSVLSLVCPHLLQPIPSFCVLQLQPRPGMVTTRLTVPRHVMVNSVPVSGTPCQFRTTSDLDVIPLQVTEVNLASSVSRGSLALRLSTTNGELVSSIDARRLRFFISADNYVTHTILLWLTRHVGQVTVSRGARAVRVLPGSVIKGCGFAENEAVIPVPQNTFDGFRLLQEYFAFQHKFHFFEITLPPELLSGLNQSSVSISIHFTRPLPPEVKLTQRNLLLNCVPAANLFSHSAEPFKLEPFRRDYPVHTARRRAEHMQIFRIERMTFANTGQEIKRFESFDHALEHYGENRSLYFKEYFTQTRENLPPQRRVAIVDKGLVHKKSLSQTVSIDALVSNGNLPNSLAPGDIYIATATTPSFVSPTNVTQPTQIWQPVLDGSLHWQLISALSMNFLSLQDVRVFKSILSSLDTPARQNRQYQRESERRNSGIVKIRSEAIDRIFRGVPIRGTRTIVSVKESQFSSEGELVLFGNILDRLISLYVTVNSFHELLIEGLETGESYAWTNKRGIRPLI